MHLMTRLLTSTALVFVLLGAGPAWACGFLIAENGAIRLDTFTAAAILDADGTAHYVTAFSFNGTPESFGAIIPLPDVPTTVERAPDWFLQRLGIETTPVEDDTARLAAVTADTAAAEAEVVAVYEVDALDITVLQGGGAEVLDWADANGYDVGVADGDLEDRTDAVAMLDFYGQRSPYFAALRFDNGRAVEQGLASGDGTPVRFSFADQDQAWIPVSVLGFDKPADEVVVADLYFLTTGRPTILGGQVPGTEVVFQRDYVAADPLVTDLVDDERADWIPTEFTLTRIDVRTEQRLLDFDLAAEVGEIPDAVSAFGVSFTGEQPADDQLTPLLAPSEDRGLASGVLVALALAVAGLAVALIHARQAAQRATGQRR